MAPALNLLAVDDVHLPRINDIDSEGNYALYHGGAANRLGLEPKTSLPAVEQFALPSETIRDQRSKLVVTVVYMSIFAVLGAFLRIIIAQLFGEECSNPGTVGWLAASAPLCVTADGSGQREGGIIFADLPANLLGSFLMGMLQSTDSLGIHVSVPIAWTTTDSWFQQWDIIHLAMRTGFCGSLTTFSSWNSAMVVTIFGSTTDYASQTVRALLGYVIGMEASLGSFVFGKKTAEWIFRWLNPAIWQEALLSEEKKACGVYVDSELPEFERRFLANLDMPGLEHDIHPDRLGFLERWRFSTSSARQVGHEDIDFLKQVEHRVLLHRSPVYVEDESNCADRGWDLISLLKWAQDMPSPIPKRSPNDHFLFKPSVSIFLLVTMYTFLMCGLFLNKGITAYAVTTRTMVYAIMCAPPGALLRWFLGGFNGKLGGSWSWLPVGTLTANLVGSVVSITAIALEFISPSKGFWEIATLRSVKIGFAGSLTTVSTFVAEVHSFSSKQATQDRAYIYMVVSLLPSCILGVLIFGFICSGDLY